MKIAIVSDVHDHRENVQKFLVSVQEQGVEHIIHLGDYGARGLAVKPIVESGIPVTGIWGNNDGEVWAITKLFENTKDCEILRTVYGSTEIGGKKFFMVHFNDLHDIVAKSGAFDVVLYGHNHLRDIHTVGSTLVCNPGALCGNKESASYAIYNTVENVVRHVEV